MLDEHDSDLGAFLTQDDKGRMLPGYLSDISKALLQEQCRDNGQHEREPSIQAESQYRHEVER